MASSYPGALDSFTTKTDGVDDVLAAHVNSLQDAVVAVETELGTDPAGTFADVVTRLDNHPLNKLNGTTAPGVGDDVNDGYGPGSIWIDTTNDRVYFCVDATAGAAVWYAQGGDNIGWTPTLTQSGSVAATVVYAKYHRVGDLVTAQCYMSVTGSGTGGNAIVLGGLPYSPASQSGSVSIYGVASIIDSGTAAYYGFATTAAAGTLKFQDSNTRGEIGVNPNFALANTDLFFTTISYFV